MKLVYEVLDELKKTKIKDEKLNILKTHKEFWALRDVLRGTYDSNIKFRIPKGTPPYVPNVEGSIPGILNKRHVDFQYFVENGPSSGTPQHRVEKMFITLLETIHPGDAEVVIAMTSKKNIPGVSRKLIKEAYPELLTD